MSQELMTQTNAVMKQPSITSEQIELLKRTIAKDHTDDELKLFVAYCNSKGLDPFSREVYSIKRQGKITFQIGIDGLRAKAEESGEYGGSEVAWCGADGEWVDVWLAPMPPAAAKVTVYRKGCDKGFTAIAKWDEYKPAEAFMWQKMPSNQLAKCAEALALRKAFPNKTGGLYTTDEMAQASSSPKPQIAMPRAKSDVVAAITAQAPARDEPPLEEPTPENPAIDFPPPPQDEPVVKTGMISDKQRKMLFAKMKKAKMPENVLRAHIKQKYGTEHTSELPWQAVAPLVEWIDSFEALNADASYPG